MVSEMVSEMGIVWIVAIAIIGFCLSPLIFLGTKTCLESFLEGLWEGLNGRTDAIRTPSVPAVAPITLFDPSSNVNVKAIQDKAANELPLVCQVVFPPVEIQTIDAESRAIIDSALHLQAKPPVRAADDLLE